MTDYQKCNKCGAEMEFGTDKYIFGKFVNGQLVGEYPRVHICLNCAQLVIDYCNEPPEEDEGPFTPESNKGAMLHRSVFPQKTRGRPRRQQ